MSAVTAYRIVKKKYADSAFEGLGAKRHGGRWNSRGVQVVYGSDSIALAALELLVHLKRPEILSHYAAFRVTLRHEQVMALGGANLPKDWRDNPPPPSTADIGDAWIADAASLALAVPSVVVPMQLNFLLNPEHIDFPAMVAKAEEIPFDFDPRLAVSASAVKR